MSNATDSAVHKKMSFKSIPSFNTAEFEELSNIYASEYNKPDLHDRVLVLDVVKDEREPIQNAAVSLIGDEEEANTRSPDSPNSESTDKESKQSPPSQAKSTKRKNSQEGDDAPSVDKKKPRVLLSSEDGHEAGKLTSEGEADVSSVGALTDEEKGPAGELCSSTTPSDFSNSDLPRQHKIFVHSTWLAVHSGYFRSLFYSGLSESHLKEVHLKISECEEKGHLLLLEAMYRPDILNGASVDDLLVVLELADKYQVKFVFTKCKYVLKTNATTIENCEKIMIYVAKLKHNGRALEDLKITLSTFVFKTFSPLDETWQTEAFTKLSVRMIGYLLGKGSPVTVQSENTVFHALMHWIECCNTRDIKYLFNDAHLVGFMVRFEYLTVDYLHNVVQHHPVASKMTGFMQYYTRGVTYHAMKCNARKCLQVKPVPRPTVQLGTIVQYWWTLPKTQVNSLPSEAKLTSDEFWSCGYKMQMSLKKLDDSSQFGYMYNIGINFQLLELREESFVALKWKIRCESIAGCEGLGEHTPDNAYSFSSKCRECPYEVYIVWKNATDRHSYKLGLVIQLL